ncbi:peptide ABC transporter permease [Pseudalkalibacillus caeni]|uniref:Peptide ABC transporter permease n=1 Tax=Exobacillus caeni TaxID=2574798 RepID=A0A5R9F0G3_9BACL|nr:peptide ABC transporter permease [Pseudalkalibacillus caeni]TLS37027.1 peptide ABC transporter permease [Pseudalkalibacillus caeni]
MIRGLLGNKSFMFSFGVIVLLLFSSIVYSVVFENHIPKADLRFEEGAELVSKPPYSPFEYPPLGTDNISNDLFFIILVGAKYTLGIALAVAVFRFIISSVLGTFLQMNFPGIVKRIQPWLEGFYYFPVSLLTFLLLEWVLKSDGYFDGIDSEFTYSLFERVGIEFIILILVAVPITSSTIAKEVKRILEQEFIDSVKILGGSKFHILKTHVMPFLKPQLLLIFVREVIQVLLLLAHLGVLKIFFGGGLVKEDMFNNSVFVSLSNEWSGLIGNNLRFLFTNYYWIPLVPILFFTITIVLLKIMLEALKTELQPSTPNKVGEKENKLQNSPSLKAKRRMQVEVREEMFREL